MSDYVVRPIEDAELLDWVAVMHVAFHATHSAEEEARHRRDTRHQDLSRTLGAFDAHGHVVGTYFSFAAQLTLPGSDACVATNAVTAVSVLPTHHRRGLLRRMMGTDLAAAKERGEAASILIAAEYPIYGRFGFGPATEHAAYRLDTGNAEFLSAAPGTIELVSADDMRHIAPSLFDAFRRACPGQIDREPIRWDIGLGLRPAPWREPNDVPRCAIYTAPGASEPSGYLVYKVQGDWRFGVPSARLDVEELVALDGEAYLGLWRYCAEIDLVGEVTAELRRIHEPLPYLLANPRKALHEVMRADFLWLRPLDTARLLAARRYSTEDRLVLQVDDPLELAGGRFMLEGGPEGATCRATTQTPDLSLRMSALGALSLGGSDLNALALAGLVQEEVPGALHRAGSLFQWPISPWCSTFF